MVFSRILTKTTIVSLFLLTIIFLSTNSISDSSLSSSFPQRIFSDSTTNSQEESQMELPSRHMIMKISQWETIQEFVWTQPDVQLAIGTMVICLWAIICSLVGKKKLK